MKFGILINLCIYFVSVNNQLINGDDCEDNKGKCILLKDCPPVLQAFQNGVYPKTCGFQQKHPLVCCTNDALTNRISEIKCKKYSATESASTLFSSDFAEPQEVGGMLSVAKEFPHMAALGYRSRYNIVFLCGGSLISEQFVLTSAHCLTSYQFGPVQIIRLGEVNTIPSSLRSSSKYYGIKRRIPHPDYKSSSMYNDIALIELEYSVQFNDFIKPACLHINHNIPSNMELIITGWGLTKYERDKIETLQKVSLDLFTDEECNDTYSSEIIRRLKNGISHDTQFCAGGRNSIRDSCQGDSGGPLQIRLSAEKKYSIVGISSFGKACDAPNEPGVYTRVSYYVPWIENVIWSN